MLFCERLRNLIEDNNLTQKQLATDLSIPTSTLGGYVQGTSEPDFETTKIIARYFNVTTDYLLNHSISNSINTEKEAEILMVFRSMTNKEQEIYIEQGKAILRIGNSRK